ncbi:TetR/AcrR family transcriptional regulator [Ectobacillus ponti]|uniref:TetR/AcrR family transcriptional regulator n=1 Tax=Ectobacillus ponti TaxID=2961894 RepID=A0AA41X842_9BACI|nr:TetR/AcrR family transcriptional regulator [Ectobacillus ponti]MCP8970492.1 TetR/AcrR family transcriptional regulator [Ectobacillus ponti]
MTTQRFGRSPGRPKSAEKSVSTKESVLHAAASLFLQNGFQKVSIDDIAKEAGVTKASVYYYFGSKAELFTETMIAMMKRIREQIAQLLQADTSLYERLLAVAVAHLRSTATFDLEGFMRESRTSLSEEQMEQMRLAEEGMYECVEEAFLQAIQEEDIPEVNARFAAHSFIALVRVGNYRQPDGSFFFETTEEAAAQIMSVFWNGFFSSPAS